MTAWRKSTVATLKLTASVYPGPSVAHAFPSHGHYWLRVRLLISHHCCIPALMRIPWRGCLHPLIMPRIPWANLLSYFATCLFPSLRPSICHFTFHSAFILLIVLDAFLVGKHYPLEHKIQTSHNVTNTLSTNNETIWKCPGNNYEKIIMKVWQYTLF